MKHLLCALEWVRTNHSIQLSRRSNNNRNLQSKLLLHLLRNSATQFPGKLILRTKDNIAALDVGLHICTSSSRKDLRKHLHRQHVLATDVDPSQQSDMSRISLRHSSIHRKPVLLNWSYTPRKRNIGASLNRHAQTTNRHHDCLSRT